VSIRTVSVSASLQSLKDGDEELLRENNVYVKHLPPDVDNKKLEEMFKVVCSKP
jgi:hypothetical protein